MNKMTQTFEEKCIGCNIKPIFFSRKKLCNGCYQTAYYYANLEKRRLQNKQNQRKNYPKNRELILERVKRYVSKNIEQVKKYQKEYRLGNREKRKILDKRDIVKYKARYLAKSRGFRRPFCLLCSLKGTEKSSKDFHHTDYESNLGYSVCKKHHLIANKWLKEAGVNG